MADFNIRVKVDASGAKRGSAETKRALGGVEQAAHKTRQVLLGVFAGLSAAAAINTTVRTMASFSQEMSTVQAVTEASASTMRELRDVAKDLGATTRFSATQAATAMVNLSRAGFTAAETMETVDDALKLAQAGALDLGRASEVVAGVVRGFRLDTSEAGKVVDVLARAANSAATDVNQFAEAMKFSAPVAAGLGRSLEETSAAALVLSDNMLGGSLAGTGLKKILGTLEAGTPATAKELAKLGLTLDDVRPSTNSLTELLTKLKDAGVDTGQAFLLFGQRGGPAFEILANNIPKIEELEAKLRDAGGTADKIATVMDDNLNGALLAVKSAFEAVILAMGDAGSESTLTQFFRNLASVLRWVADNVDNFTTAVKIAGVSLAIAFAPSILQGVITLLTKMAVSITTASAAMVKFSASAVASQTATVGMGAGFLALKTSAIQLGNSLKSLWAIVAANPLLAVGAVAIGGTIALMDKYNRELDATIAATEKAQIAAIRHRQAMVREIQERKKANANLASYIEKLGEENRVRTISVQARREEEAIEKALEIAKRDLTDQEEATIRALVRKRAAIEEANRRTKEEADLLASIKEPQAEYNHQVELLDSLLRKAQITEEEHLRTLQELRETYGQLSDTGVQEYINRLKQENQLQTMSASDRELQQALIEAQAQSTTELTEAQRQEIAALIAARQLNAEILADREKERSVLESIKGPQEELIERERILNKLREDGKITAQEYSSSMDELRLQSLQFATDMESGYARGFLKIKQSILDVASTSERTLTNAFNSAQDALVDLVVTGKADFKSLVDSMLADLTRLLLQKLALAVIPGFQTGGSFNVPGFQTGGSFTVGGQGGPDSKMAMFRVTPQEKVTVTRPGEAKKESSPVVNANTEVVNVIDPRMAIHAMQSQEGKRVILNTIRSNPDAVKRLLGG